MQESSGGGVAVDQLLNFFQRIERNYYEWHALHLHLSRLKPHHRREFQLRIAANEFDALLRSRQSELFQLASGDLIYFWKEGSTTEIDQIVLRLRYLFSDDPLVSAAPEPEGAREPLALETAAEQLGFCTWHDLERDYERFRLEIEDLQRESRSAAQGASPYAVRSLDPSSLARLEGILATVDLSGLLRRQPICAVLPEGPPHPILHEVYIALGELAKRVAPGFDLTADRWLFQHLAETLDRRLLNWLVQEPSVENVGPLSVNMRFATLLSPEFLKFDQQFRRRSKGNVVIELQLVDIYAELGAFLFIREYVRERGYRICIDGLHHFHLPLISRKRLGIDLVKLVWSPDLQSEVNSQRFRELEAAINQTGVDRVILSRCDSADAVAWGQSLGLRLFQGYYIDSRLKATRSPRVAAARQAMRAGNGR